jgi:diguanylate cyclase (GGDEF)-like protein
MPSPPPPRPADSSSRRPQRRGARRLWSAKEQYRVLAVAVMAALVFVVVASVANRRIDRIDDQVLEVRDRALPAREALVDVERALRSSQYAFTLLVSEPDPVQRVLAVEGVRQTLTSAEQAWADYGELARGLDCDGTSEASLQTEFDEAKARQDELTGPVGLALVNPEDNSVTDLLQSESFVGLRLAQEDQRLVVEQLISECYDPIIEGAVDASVRAVADGRREVRWLLFAGALAGLLIAGVAFRSATEHEREEARLAAQRERQSRRNELEAKLQRALNMSPTEPDALQIVEEALALSRVDRSVDLLLADSSEAHFHRVLSTGPDPHGPGCPVGAPVECPAAQGTETKVFPASDALDACPNLRCRPGQLSAVCVPVTVAGRSLGVLHAVGPGDDPADPEAVDHLELIGDRLGNRLSLLRAMAERESQARTDPLTGLLNRRSLETAVRPLVEGGGPYVVAFGDFDHFKVLNDTYGHEVGDRALRLFARALREALRPMDLACRYGGEEFVLVIPDVSVEEGVEIVERVRSALAQLLASGTTPSFTVSFGVADRSTAVDFPGVIELADRALLRAKAAGRDRVLVAAGPQS